MHLRRHAARPCRLRPAKSDDIMTLCCRGRVAVMERIGDVHYSILNGLRFNAMTREWYRGAPPTESENALHAAYVRLLVRSARAQLEWDTASPIAAVCDRVSARVRDALAEAYAEPIPIWLLIHLWRNGISMATFMFELNDSLEAELRAFTAAMRELSLELKPSATALTCVGRRLWRPSEARHLPRAQARGQLPSSYDMGFVVLDEDSTTAFEWLFTVKAIDAYPQLLALQEELFLNPAESAMPHGFRICAVQGDGTTTMPNLLGTSTEQCEFCGGNGIGLLYWHDSVSYKALRRGMRTLDEENIHHLGPLQMSNTMCRCSICAACRSVGPAMKRCAACEDIHCCNAACQRAHWKEHRADCRAARKQSADPRASSEQ